MLVCVRRIVDSSWLLLGALFALTVAASLFSGRAPTRVAIRVAPADAALAESIALDVWSEERGPNLPLDVVITDDQLARFPTAQILVPDIDAVARDEHERLSRAEAQRPADWFAEYHDYKAIEDHLRALVALAPGRVELRGIGASIDSRPIWALRVGNGGTRMLVNG